jgi:4-amino-4-deoxy-L-arabinose transferase-like glycosyltransferase
VIGPAARPSVAVRAALAVAIVGGVIAIRAPLMDLPLERDEGEYAYIAWRMAAGETPYIDWFDQKPPAVFLAYRLALALPGDPIVAIRAVAGLFAAASALALFGLARSLLGPVAAGVAALLLAFLSADPMGQGPVANTEIFMLPWILVAALIAFPMLGDPRPRIGVAAVIGLSLGVATAFKQVAAVNAAFLLVVCAWCAPRGSRVAAAARFGAGMAAGGIAVWAGILLWFALRGGLAAALDAILLHNLAYASELGWAERGSMFRFYVTPLLPSQGAVWLLAAVGLAALALRPDRFPAVFLGGFAAANALGVSASGRYFPHYFQQILPAVATLAAAAIAGTGATPQRVRLVAGTALALVPLLVAAVGFWRITPAEASQRIYPDNLFDVMPAIAAEVASQTAPGDRVFVFGAEPELLFLARRASATRYIFLFPVFEPYPDTAARQAEVISEVLAARPAAIVWAPMQSFFGRDRPQQLTEWTRSYIDAHYRLAAYATAAAGHGEVRRVAPGEDASALLAQLSPWARIFVRAP